MKREVLGFLDSILLALLATAVVGLDNRQIKTKTSTTVHRLAPGKSSEPRNQLKERDGYYNYQQLIEEYEPLKLKYKPTPNYNQEAASHFPVHPQTPYTPPKTPPSYHPSASLYPSTYETGEIYDKLPSSYPPLDHSRLPHSSPEHVDRPYRLSLENEYPSIYYKDVGKLTETYSHASQGFHHNDNLDFSKFGDLFKDRLSIVPNIQCHTHICNSFHLRRGNLTVFGCPCVPVTCSKHY
uniref:Uncharacterized protein n=1 Tax=Daphnia magna TaxID=35525 RepID=A0A0P6F8R8_9CRUS